MVVRYKSHTIINNLFEGADGSRQVIVRLKSTTEKSDDSTRSTEADLHLSLSSFYPSNAPSISVRSEQLSRSGMTQLRTMLTQAAEHSLDRPMLLDLISLASEELQKVTVCDGKMRTTDQGGGGNSASVCFFLESGSFMFGVPQGLIM